jgi:hypothetical protein
MSFEPTDKKIVMEFENERMAYHFKLWLCEQGEQDYWMWMEVREQEEDGDITAHRFGYHDDPNKIIGKSG